MLTAQELIDFEQDIAECYKHGQIKAPIHLRDGCEEALRNIFAFIGPQDYVYSTWGSHLHALLKGVPKNLVKSEILAGNSITLHFPKYNFYTSAIVGGIAPIAVGTAMGLQRQKRVAKVYAFLGDMAFQTGIVYESVKYAHNFALPITWIVEDNGKSVCTPTDEAWGEKDSCFNAVQNYYQQGIKNIIYYRYTQTWPHSGIGQFIGF